jgi:hypothetical protein
MVIINKLMPNCLAGGKPRATKWRLGATVLVRLPGVEVHPPWLAIQILRHSDMDVTRFRRSPKMIRDHYQTELLNGGRLQKVCEPANCLIVGRLQVCQVTFH